jgi:hypothetical protein
VFKLATSELLGDTSFGIVRGDNDIEWTFVPPTEPSPVTDKATFGGLLGVLDGFDMYEVGAVAGDAILSSDEQLDPLTPLFKNPVVSSDPFPPNVVHHLNLNVVVRFRIVQGGFPKT